VSKFVPGQALDLACGDGRHSLWLAEHRWDVTGVDYSRAALEILQQRARDKGVHIKTVLADLERHEFVVEAEAYDLIIVCNYLQRDLFASIRKGTRIGGIVIAIIPIADNDPEAKPMNPAYLLNPGQLRDEFRGWELLHDVEGKLPGDTHKRAMAQLVARRRA
jgi:SAM-dependent methyltransferase